MKPCVYCGTRTYIRLIVAAHVAVCFACLKRNPPSRPKGLAAND